MDMALTPYEKLSGQLRSPEAHEVFAGVVGDYNAVAYVHSVLIAVANNPALIDCGAKSILSSAVRAATLRLSVDPGTRQAYLVPFKGQCTLVIGAKGLYDMAIRTGKYRYLQVGTIYEGETCEEDRMTGYHSIKGNRTSDKAIGYILSFQLTTGYSKTFYMSVEEIHAHAAKYSKSYNQPNGVWKTNKTEMEKKTVLRLGLTRWGVFDPHDLQALGREEEPDESIPGEFTSITDIPAKVDPDAIIAELYGEAPVKPAAPAAPAPLPEEMTGQLPLSYSREDAERDARKNAMAKWKFIAPTVPYDEARVMKTKSGQTYDSFTREELEEKIFQLGEGISQGTYKDPASALRIFGAMQAVLAKK